MIGDLGELFYEGKEPIENVVTWVYEDGSFVPSAKIIDEEKFSIVSDYIGRPIQAYNGNGEKVWETDYDIYGRLVNLRGEKSFIPFRQLGQYEDEELGGLYYNRFRYYDSNSGTYLSKDPIGLAGRNLNLYAYVHDINSWVDILGLDIVNPNDINYSQRTVSEVRVFDSQKYSPIRVMDVDGQLVTYDNRRLLSAQNAGLNELEVEIVDPNAAHPDSTTGKTWAQKFKERFSDIRNKKAGGVVPDSGVKTKPKVPCK